MYAVTNLQIVYKYAFQISSCEPLYGIIIAARKSNLFAESIKFSQKMSTQKRNARGVPFPLLFDIISKHSHHLVGDDVLDAAGVFFGKFEVCSELHKRLSKRLMPLVYALCLFSACVGKT